MWEVVRFLLSVAVLVALIAAIVGWYQAKAENEQDALIVARADGQHRNIMDGNDTAGTYGEYPPADLGGI